MSVLRSVALGLAVLLFTSVASPVAARRSGAEPGFSYVAYVYPDLSPGTWDSVSPWTSNDGRALCDQGVVSHINLNWEDGPVFACGFDDVAVRFTGYLQVPRTGVYTFYNRSDDGFILKINRRRIISDWESQGPAYYNGSGRAYLFAGRRYEVEVWYFEDGGGATVSLLYSTGRDVPQLVPESWISH